MKKCWLIIVLMTLSLLACTKKEITIERQDLFSLQIGMLANEVNLLKSGETFFNKKVFMTMHEGFFYISNPESGKVMKFSSHGDIMSILYDKSQNPPFATEQDQRLVKVWNFHEPSNLAVNSDGTLFVQDRFSVTKEFTDNTGSINYDYVILMFDSKGDYIDYLGRNGRGGDKFELMQNIQLTTDDNIVVICRNLANWQVYWFNKEGEPLYDIDQIIVDAMPNEEQASDIYIEGIIADKTKPLLYIHTGSVVQNNEIGIENIYIYDVVQNQYIKNFKAPTGVAEFYELIGVDDQSNLYFLTAHGTDKAYSIKILSSDDGALIKEIELDMDDFTKPLTFRNIHLSSDGILSALFGSIDGIYAVWWQLEKTILFETEESL